MVYANPFLRMVVSGTLYNTEQFSWSLSFIQNTVAGDVPDDVPAGIVTALQVFHQGTDRISQYAKMNSVKLNLIGTDGRYARNDTVEHEYAPPISGSVSFAIVPQVALVVSTLTGFRRGLAHAGRFYLPLPGEGVDSTGAINPTFVLNTATAAATLIRACNTALGSSWSAGVVSDIGPGAERRITAVKVGRILDTMRSRRSSLVEDYREVAV